jgi:hypothetical protein
MKKKEKILWYPFTFVMPGLEKIVKSQSQNSDKESVDGDIICNVVGCKAQATDHIQTQGYDGNITLALCKSCCSEWEEDYK